MASYLYRCPITGDHVQGWTDFDPADANQYETVHCLACQLVHLVNPATGKIVGDEGE